MINLMLKFLNRIKIIKISRINESKVEGRKQMQITRVGSREASVGIEEIGRICARKK